MNPTAQPDAVAPNRREIRLSLVKSCNFRCFFCHSEGIDRHGKEPKVSAGERLEILNRAGKMGYDDITFTGGEPTLLAEELTQAIHALALRTPPPAVTIVSNGSRFDSKVIAALVAYPGQRKVNFSLHALNESDFDQVTGTRGQWSRVQKNLAWLVEAGIPVKLNTVILKGINAGPEPLYRHIEYAAQTGVTGIKLIEFMVTPDNRDHYGYFYSRDAILRDLEIKQVVPIRSNLRTTWLRAEAFPDLSIEVVQCVCKLGCAHCNDVRDVQVSADRLYHPCFVQSHQGIDLGATAEDFGAALDEGRRRIAVYGTHYGDDSPLLIHRDQFVLQREEVFWQTNESAATIEKLLASARFTLRKIRQYRLNYCLPRTDLEPWLACGPVIKFGCDTHTPNRFEIVFSDHAYRPFHGGLVTTVIYRTRETEVIPAQSEADALFYMQAHGYRLWFSQDFVVHDYDHQALSFSMSLDMGAPMPSLRLTPETVERPEVRPILEELGFTPMTVPLTALLAEAAGANPRPRPNREGQWGAPLTD